MVVVHIYIVSHVVVIFVGNVTMNFVIVWLDHMVYNRPHFEYMSRDQIKKIGEDKKASVSNLGVLEYTMYNAKTA